MSLNEQRNSLSEANNAQSGLETQERISRKRKAHSAIGKPHSISSESESLDSSTGVVEQDPIKDAGSTFILQCNKAENVVGIIR